MKIRSVSACAVALAFVVCAISAAKAAPYRTAYLADEAFDYEVLFTNPICRAYKYKKPMKTVSGEYVSAKKKNVFCTFRDSGQWKYKRRKTASPQKRLIEWIDHEDTKSIFLTYLSFSNATVRKALCRAVERGVEVTLQMDKVSYDRSADQALTLENCGASVSTNGHSGEGKSGISWAHNKLTLINAEGPKTRIVFGSGNLSSGPNLHHENWHFITLPSDTYFAPAHVCLKNTLLSSSSKGSAEKFARAMNKCRTKIPYPEEEDISVFFLPNKAETNLLKKEVTQLIEDSYSLYLAAHRLSSGWLIRELRELQTDFG